MPASALPSTKVTVKYLGPAKAIKLSEDGEEHPANGEPFQMPFNVVKVMQGRGHRFEQVKNESPKTDIKAETPAAAPPAADAAK